MGFYSFYRIFKDIIKSIFGNKAWRYTLIIALIVAAFTIFSVKSNAADLRPWNVYTNTTEFNWNRLTFLNYVDTSYNLTNYTYEVHANEVYYLYNPNSSTGNLRFYCYVSNDNNMILQLLEHTPQYSYLNLETSYQYTGGYVEIPYNKPFTPQFSCTLSISSSAYELYMLDDKYSNIEAYNELSAIADYLYGSPTELTSEFSVVNNLTIGDPTTNGTFTTTTSASQIYYMPLEEGRITNLDLSVTLNPTYSYVFVGYCDSIPSNGVSYIHYAHYTGSSSFNITGSFSSHKYLFIRTFGGSVTINSSSVNNVGLEGMNNNATYQGEATRETITDSSISQNSSDYTLPTDSTNDITASGFATIFDRIKNTFTSPTSTPIVITVPFTGKTFTISKQTVYGSANLGIVQTLIECFWWYIIALFVCKDVFKKIEKLKTGNIEFTETTNIKEDIL